MQAIINFIKKILGLRRRTKVIGIVVILLVLFLVFRGRSKPTPLQFVTVSKNNIESQVSASGILSGKNVAVLHFNISGKLSYLGFNTGDAVQKGQIVASLDGTTLSAALQQAINNRRNTQANVDYIHDQVKGNDGSETFAQKAARTAAEVANDNAYDAVRAAQKALTDATLVSPISGIVVAHDDLSVGQNVTPSNLISQIVDFSQMRFEATVDESDIGQVQIGQKATLTLNAYGDTQFSGQVTDIASETRTDNTGSITVTVKIQIDDPRITQIYGLNGQADIVTNSKQGVLVIPQDALLSDTVVYVKNANGKVEKRTIQTGIKSDTEVEVISGLNEGEQVVTNPQAVTL